MSLDLDHFSERILQDALTEATSAYWLRRARDFESARSRPNDYLGESTSADVAARDARLTGLANACRARAGLVPLLDDGDLVELMLDEVVR